MLGWKGGVNSSEKKIKKNGSLNYLAQWQGIRGENLFIDTSVEKIILCSRTGSSVVFAPRPENSVGVLSSKEALIGGGQMRLDRYNVRNYRRLEDVEISLEPTETIFVGANNAGKTSATAAFRAFISNRSDFKIHDFPTELINEFDRFGDGQALLRKELPSIEMDLWFSFNPDIEYGRIAYLLPRIGIEDVEAGVRLQYSVISPEQLLIDYNKSYPPIEVATDTKSNRKRKLLSHYLAQDGVLKKHFSLKYYVLEKVQLGTALVLHPLDHQVGRKALSSLIRVDFVDAQRNIDDGAASKSNRLSDIFFDFYKHNLSKMENDNESLEIIEKSNDSLSDHYEKEFKSLIQTIEELGFPGANDRKLKVISNLNPEKALGGNAVLTYFDIDAKHPLPESYNGLGYKNLIYMAIQVAHFQIQWLNAEVDRPLCQMIFIEEPEAHLHAQVQQVFIRKIRKAIQKTTKNLGHETHSPQLVITTHSSHIIAEADFKKIRYFRRCISNLSVPKSSSNKATATKILNLAKFASESTEQENLVFLKKYLSLTHCDLFFADAAVIIEGTVERILLPHIIRNYHPILEYAYITTLQLGGAFAHKFLPLIKFLDLTCLVITDLDSVDRNDNRKSCRADIEGAVSSNPTITTLLLNGEKGLKGERKAKYERDSLIKSLLTLRPDQKIVPNSKIYVTFQEAIDVVTVLQRKEIIPRTFEESFIYTNFDLVVAGRLDVLIEYPENATIEQHHQKTYEAVVKDFKKVEFALRQIETLESWKAPKYISDGLTWLSSALSSTTDITLLYDPEV
ncbi:ATP-dependent nuclease [Pseudomonas syringae]|uniref:ATP-dependent nuclease n=1 Tax=Pseudomonas syringae TaxID=317 RepID=UPI0018A2D3C1|nr:ATP-dependent endonuclease [Pseudomonas syringae]